MRLCWVVGGEAPTRGGDSVGHPVRAWPPRRCFSCGDFCRPTFWFTGSFPGSVLWG